MNDEALPSVSLMAHEVEIERKTRTIKGLIIGWAITVITMATAIGVVIYGG